MSNNFSFPRQRTFELIGVIITAIGKFVFMDYLNWRFPFVVTAILIWTTYIIYQSKKDKTILKHWGFRRDNFKDVMRLVLPFGIFAIVSFIIIGLYQDTINLTWHIIPILILYPIWGIIQQFLLIALVAGNLHELKGEKINKVLIILFAALIFASVHYPDYWLILGTFILAIFYGLVYLKKRNIYVLGLFHGWLGALFYYTVVNRDPFLETFGKFIY